jgi:hypothetical protein
LRNKGFPINVVLTTWQHKIMTSASKLAATRFDSRYDLIQTLIIMLHTLKHFIISIFQHSMKVVVNVSRIVSPGTLIKKSIDPAKLFGITVAPPCRKTLSNSIYTKRAENDIQFTIMHTSFTLTLTKLWLLQRTLFNLHALSAVAYHVHEDCFASRHERIKRKYSATPYRHR